MDTNTTPTDAQAEATHLIREESAGKYITRVIHLANLSGVFDDEYDGDYLRVRTQPTHNEDSGTADPILI